MEDGVGQVDAEGQPFEHHGGLDGWYCHHHLDHGACDDDVLLCIRQQYSFAIYMYLGHGENQSEQIFSQEAGMYCCSDPNAVIRNIVNVIKRKWCYLVHSLWGPLLEEDDLIGFVIYSHRVSASYFSSRVTIFIVDNYGEIVKRNNFLYQNICTVFLKTIIRPIKCNIMRVSPAGAYTCAKKDKKALRKTQKTRPEQNTCELLCQLKLTFAFILVTTATFVVYPDGWVVVFTLRFHNMRTVDVFLDH